MTADNHILLTDEWGFNLHEYSFTPGPDSTLDVGFHADAAPAPGRQHASRCDHAQPDGQIYITDYWNQRIEYMNTDGSDAAAFGFRGSLIAPRAPSTSRGPRRSSRAPAMSLLPTARATTLRCSLPTGGYITQWGKKGTANGDFNFPQGIAFAPDGTLYVSDFDEMGASSSSASGPIRSARGWRIMASRAKHHKDLDT